MAVTPYLKKLNTDGGTLYVFPSVSKDLTRTFVSNDYEFKFSHFACLNLPDIVMSSFSEDSDSDSDNDLEKGLYLSTFGSVSDEEGVALVENLQNYVMNFETAILNGEGDNDDYDQDVLTTVSEKVFFNWLQKVGGINFTDGGTLEDYNKLLDRTVQYIGDLDVVNTVEVGGDTFEELYMHIPSTVGASTKVYFRLGEQTDRKNYLNKNYRIGGSEYIIGRTNQDESPYGLSIEALVDFDYGENTYVGDIGHTIDFRDTSYGDGISTMNGESLEDFEFNAVLIYYDLLQKTSNINIKRTSTNLYGILILDNVKKENGKAYIQRYPKYRETIYGNGNSYSLKLDLKIDTIGDTTWKYENIQDPNNAYGMGLYSSALEKLQKCTDIFFKQKTEIAKLSERVEMLENLVMGIDSISTLKEDIDRLYDICNGNSIVDTKTILGLIDETSNKLNSILSGGKDLKLQYDTDVLQPGSGIGLEKSLNKVVINAEQKYTINTVYDGSEDKNVEITPDNRILTQSNTIKHCVIELKPGENFAVIYIKYDGLSTTNMNIVVDTEKYSWDIGQSLKLYFSLESGSFEFVAGNGINIKVTDDITLYVPGEEYDGHNLIEVICIGEDKFIYLIK